MAALPICSLWAAMGTRIEGFPRRIRSEIVTWPALETITSHRSIRTSLEGHQS